MNICFDSIALYTAKNRGIGNYTISQLEEILKFDQTNNYFILNFFNCDLDVSFLKKYKNIKVINYRFGKDNASYNDYINFLNDYPDILGDITQRAIEDYKIDVFYLTSFMWTNIKYKKEWFLNAKVYATLYDVIPYIFKKQYLQSKTARKAYLDSLKSTIFFNGFAAISNSAKYDYVKLTGYDEKKIQVIGGAPNDFFKKINISKEKEDEIRKKFNITGKFVICTGGDDYRKNIEKLIIAFSKIEKKYLNNFQLVIVCKLRRERISYFKDLAKKNNIENKVILTNFVTDDELIALMNLASASSFPSMYEGFGLPVVEAYACEIPNLTSNNSSLGEIANGSSILVNPFSVKSITEGLNKLLDENNWNLLIEKGKEKLKIYNKTNVAKLTLDLILKNDLSTISTKIKRIAIFTPLPPLKSGISDYSYDIINKLSDYIDIDVFIDNGYTPIKFNKKNINVYNYRKFITRSKSYDKIIYEVGNSTYHSYMFEIMNKYKGIVELHDGNYKPLVDYLCFAAKKKISKKEYFDLIKYDLNNDIYKGKDNIFCSSKIENLTVRNFLLQNAESVIVHSDYLKKEILKSNIIKSCTIPHYTVQKPMDKNELRKELNIDNNKFVISSFGIIHENKRSFELLQAFKKLHSKNNNTLLYFVGECIDKGYKEKMDTFIKENNLSDSVFVLGFVDITLFDKYIASSDIVVNLRYPYNGESSGSLSRSLGLAIPTIVNDIGSFSEFPDNVLIKIPNVEDMDNEVVCIFNTLYKYSIKPSLLMSMKDNIISYVQNNLEITKICDDYLNFFNNKRTIHLTSNIFKTLISNQFVNKKYTVNDINQTLITLSYILSFND